MTSFRKSLNGWGILSKASCLVQRPERYHQLEMPEGQVIARGLGRSYGDAALNADQNVILMERLNRLLSFDEERGLLAAEAGTSIADILEVFVPRGWFLPVTPDTKNATLGGCIACDVQGNNHPTEGSFSNHVREVELLLPDGSKVRCSPSLRSDLFWATSGGLGLTGIITEATVQLVKIPSAYIRTRHYSATDIEGILEVLSDPTRSDHYAKAWIDCLAGGKNLGRGILTFGHHARKDEILPSLEKTLKEQSSYQLPIPSLALNRWSLGLYNALFYQWKKRRLASATVHYDRFFYPLDRIRHWNRLYGHDGFIHYQFSLPLQESLPALRAVLEKVSGGPFYASMGLIKRLGREGSGLLSFPQEGFSAELDMPLKEPSLFPFLDQLDEIVLNHGGRVNLAADARMKRDKLQSMYPSLDRWVAIKKSIDPQWQLSSELSKRLALEDL